MSNLHLSPQDKREEIGYNRDTMVTEILGAIKSLGQQLEEQNKFMKNEFIKVDSRFEKIDGSFEKNDGRFEQIDSRFEKIDHRFEKIDNEFKNVYDKFEKVDNEFEKVYDDIALVRAEGANNFNFLKAEFAVVHQTLEIHGQKFANIERDISIVNQTLVTHGKSLVNIERVISAVFEVHKIAMDALVVGKKTTEKVENIVYQVAAQSRAIKTHTRQIKENTEEIQKVSRKVS